MSHMKAVKLDPNHNVTSCPMCGNNTDFNLHVRTGLAGPGPDYSTAGFHYMVWAVCECGYDPTDDDTRYIEVLGPKDTASSLLADRFNIIAALACWNAAIYDRYPQMTLDECRAMPTERVIEARIGSHWQPVIVNGIVGDCVDVHTHLYQSSWHRHRIHHTHFREWRKTN